MKIRTEVSFEGQGIRSGTGRTFIRDQRVPPFVRVVGVDGLLTPKGLVTVSLRDGQLHMIHLVKDMDDVLAEQKDAQVVAVNLPLGHDDEGPDGSGIRGCDRAARDYLGPHGDLVDLVPPLSWLEADSLEQARETIRDHDWPELSEVHWKARDRILQANRAAASDGRFTEVHAEVCFATILRELQGPEACLKRRPKSWAGQYERLSLLHVAGLRPMRSFGGIGRANPEDVLAATAAAWTAHRVAIGKAGNLPEGCHAGRACIAY